VTMAVFPFNFFVILPPRNSVVPQESQHEPPFRDNSIATMVLEKISHKR
jgi:hypothetical protein